nr:MAG TPA: hypothetical protein [Caudoviricetes sp.]
MTSEKYIMLWKTTFCFLKLKTRFSCKEPVYTHR